jgi:N-acetyltransferase 10
LADCSSCLLVDDELNILPISSHVRNIKKISLDREIDEKGDSYMTESDIELQKLKISMKDTQPVGALVDATRTFDQGKAVMKFVEAIAEKTLRSTVVLTAARGRGKVSYSHLFMWS